MQTKVSVREEEGFATFAYLSGMERAAEEREESEEEGPKAPKRKSPRSPTRSK